MMGPSKRQAGKNACAIICPDFPSSIAPITHYPELTLPNTPKRDHTFSKEKSNSEENEIIDSD